MAGLFVPFNPKGRPPKYTPDELLEQFQEYLKAREADAIVEESTEEGSTPKGETSKVSRAAHPQPISILDFCVFLGRTDRWWQMLGENSDEFLRVKTYIENYIRSYQIRGALIGAFNANIISRLLGLVDKQEVTETVVYQMKDPNE